jgi:hypothetical protein
MARNGPSDWPLESHCSHNCSTSICRYVTFKSVRTIYACARNQGVDARDAHPNHAKTGGLGTTE